MKKSLKGNAKLTLDIDLKRMTHQQGLALDIFLFLNQNGKQSQAYIKLKELELTFIPSIEEEKAKK